MRIFALTDSLILRWEVLLPAALVLACAAMLTLMYLVGPAIAGLFVIGALFSWIAAASVARSAASRRSMRRISPEIALWSGGTRRSPDVALPYRAATIVAFGPLALANVLVVVADLALRIAIPEVDTASRAILVLVGNSIGALRSYAPREWFEIRRDEIVRLSRWTSIPLQGDVVRV
ncbi:MAG: hypothetical protein HXY23_15180, partial [Parvularculaceae bacterium]|nr:hypothetical protein [Parvularculaceae bacterium]